jgi:probable HAF family extracellular repeat protein
LTDLGTLPGGDYSTATDINAAGQVVGTADSPQNVRAVLWNNGTIINLGTRQLDGLNGESQASAINDLGQIVGWSDVKSRLDYPYLEPHAFLITPEDTDGDSTPDRWFRDLDSDGVNDLMIDLACPRAPYSLGIDINNVGQVVAVGNDMASYTAFLWDSGVFTELGAIAPMAAAHRASTTPAR